MTRRRRRHAEPLRRYHARIVLQGAVGFGLFFAWIAVVATGYAS